MTITGPGLQISCSLSCLGGITLLVAALLEAFTLLSILFRAGLIHPWPPVYLSFLIALLAVLCFFEARAPWGYFAISLPLLVTPPLLLRAHAAALSVRGRPHEEAAPCPSEKVWPPPPTQY